MKAIIFSSILLMVTGCNDKKSDSPPPAEGPAAETGAIAVDPVAADTSTEVTGTIDGGTNTTPATNTGGLELGGMSEKIPLRPAMAIGVAALTEDFTDFGRHEEEKFVWNPANAPLEELNKVVCVLSNSGFDFYKNSGKYIAKINVKKCYPNAAGGATGAGPKPAPQDVVIESLEANGLTTVKMWYTRKFTSDDHHDREVIDVPKIFSKMNLEYYVETVLTEIPNKVNPFGVFSMKWETYQTLDGTVQPHAYEEGYVETSKITDSKIALKFNQRSKRFVNFACDGFATATYKDKYIFSATTEGTAINNTVFTFAGEDIQTFLNNNASVAYVDIRPSAVLVAGTATFSGGVDSSSQAFSEYDGTGFLSENTTAAANSIVLEFDGVKTIKEVTDKWNKDNAGNKVETSFFYALDNEILTNGDTITMTNGEAPEMHATASHGGDTFRAEKFGAEGNKITLVFDGTKTVTEVMSAWNTKYDGKTFHNRVECNSCADTNAVLAAATVTFSGGTSRSYDVYADMIQYAANAEMEIIDGKPYSGKAHSSEKYLYELVGTPVCRTSWGSAFADTSGSYGMAFNKADQTSDSNFPGRTVSKYFDETGQASTYNHGGFDATAPRCEQIGGELADVYTWDIFNEDGSKLNFQTDVTLFKQNSTSSWGDGYASSYGTFFFEPISDGEQVHYVDGNGTTVNLTASTLSGELMSPDYINVIETLNTDKVFRCDYACPTGELSQSEIDNFDYNSPQRTYVFDSTNDIFLYDADASNTVTGGDVEIKFGSGVTGHLYIQLTEILDPNGTPSDGDAYQFILDTYFQPVSLKNADNSAFVPPSEMVFESGGTYDNSTHAYPGTESIAENMAHNGSTFFALADNQDLTYTGGGLCCFGWEEKAAFKSEWGGTVSASKITLKKGTTFTLKNDPDGAGPLAIGKKIKLAPTFTELRPVLLTSSDCSTTLVTTVDDISPIDGSTTLPIPQPLPLADRDVKTGMGTKTTESLPVKVKQGRKI